MTPEAKPPTLTEDEVKRMITNDSLGTIDSADSTGSDETKETGDGKRGTPTLGKTEKGVLHAIFTQLNDPNSPAHVSGKSPQPGRRGGQVT